MVYSGSRNREARVVTVVVAGQGVGGCRGKGGRVGKGVGRGGGRGRPTEKVMDGKGKRRGRRRKTGGEADRLLSL